jgi:hypothetical protein
VRTEGRQILEPPKPVWKLWPITAGEVTRGRDPGEWTPSLPKGSLEHGDWEIQRLPIGPAVTRQEATVEEARREIHNEEVVRSNADLGVKASQEFTEIFAWYAGRTKGVAPPSRPNVGTGAAAVRAPAATKSGAATLTGLARRIRSAIRSSSQVEAEERIWEMSQQYLKEGETKMLEEVQHVARTPTGRRKLQEMETQLSQIKPRNEQEVKFATSRAVRDS